MSKTIKMIGLIMNKVIKLLTQDHWKTFAKTLNSGKRIYRNLEI